MRSSARATRAALVGLDYVKVSLGLVFVFGAFVFGILAPPGTLVVSFVLMIPAVALLASALQEANKRRRALPSMPHDKGRGATVGHPGQRRRYHPYGGGDGDLAHREERPTGCSRDSAGGGHLSVERAGGRRSAIRSPAAATELDEPSSAT